MPTILLETHIKSNIRICFDLARSIDLHQISTAKTNERAIEGTTSGLINLGEFVTWQATHFGIRQKLSSKITAFDSPRHFRDEQIKGIFEFIIHDHYFESQGDEVVMKDIFTFASPLGVLGKLVDYLVVSKYLRKLLVERNQIIKEFAETDQWKSLLHDRKYL